MPYDTGHLGDEVVAAYLDGTFERASGAGS